MKEKNIKIDIMGNPYYIEEGRVYLVNGDKAEEVFSRDVFLDQNGEICIGVSYETCGRGSFATVYLCGDEDHCYKVFDSPELDNIDQHFFDVLMRENLPGFYNVKHILYKKVGDEVRPAGYVMDFLPCADMKTFRRGGIDLLGKDSSYIINSYERLASSLLILSKNNILIDDTAEYNTSIEEEGLVIYDCDSFRTSNESKEDIYLKNIQSLNNLMSVLIKKSIYSFHSEVKLADLKVFFDMLQDCDEKIDFKEVFRPGEKAIDSLMEFSRTRESKK